jgi:hypothetical protein
MSPTSYRTAPPRVGRERIAEHDCEGKTSYARAVLFVALAIALLAALVGTILVTRAAMRLRRSLTQIGEVVATSDALVERVHGIIGGAAEVRAEADRLQALTRVPL